VRVATSTVTSTARSTVTAARPVRASRWVLAPFVAGLVGAVWLVGETVVGRAPPWWAIAAVAIVFLGAIALGLFTQAGLFARPIVRAAAEGAGDRLALTFDDGPDPEATRAVLDLLDARGMRATFFVIGRRAAEARDVVEEIVRRGHAVANHSFSHAHALPAWSSRRIARDLTHAEALLDEIRRAAGVAGVGRRWMRAPVGIVSPPVAEAARIAGLELVGWSATARDGVARTTVAAAHARLRAALAPGAILVLHDGAERGDRRPIAPAVLARLLDDMAARGLRSVTLDELLGARS
jgi:peptidoglycan/xylan/chitin deacetylase (PgdA/CDA1 family)